ncbi:MAG: hypothetical protein IKD96_02230 [Oscillospiraceae bacterium]|nr:hypothetical protein [Oscillospiraceae bacterium]
MEPRTLCFINLYAIFGALPKLCELDDEAKALIADKNIAVGFLVSNGPSATLRFAGGECAMYDGVEDCDIKMVFSGPEKFNAMIDGTSTPIPRKGLMKAGFMTHEFTELTKILERYLRPTPEALEDPEFKRKSTTLMFHLIAEAVAQVGNEDTVGRASTGYISNGEVTLRAEGGEAVGIRCVNHRLTAMHTPPREPTAIMEFESMDYARDLFDGKVNAVTGVGQGRVRVLGMISQLDNINRILDRVSLYLA